MFKRAQETLPNSASEANKPGRERHSTKFHAWTAGVLLCGSAAVLGFANKAYFDEDWALSGGASVAAAAIAIGGCRELWLITAERESQPPQSSTDDSEHTSPGRAIPDWE